MAKKKKKNRNSKAGSDFPRSPAPSREQSGPGEARKDIVEKVDEIKNLLLVRRTAESLDLVDLLKSKRRLMFNNFLLGLFRGIGFFLGFTIVGGLFLGIVVVSLGWVDDILDRDEGTTKGYFQSLIEKGSKFKSTTDNGLSNDEKELREIVRKILKEKNRDEPARNGEAVSPLRDGK